MAPAMAREIQRIIGDEPYATPLGTLSDEQFQLFVAALMTASYFFAGCFAEYVGGRMMNLGSLRAGSVALLWRLSDLLFPVVAVLPLLTSTIFLLPACTVVLFRGGLPLMWLHAKQAADPDNRLRLRLGMCLSCLGVAFLRLGAILGVATLGSGLVETGITAQCLLLPWVCAALSQVIFSRCPMLKIAAMFASWTWLWFEWSLQWQRGGDDDWKLLLPFDFLQISSVLLMLGFLLRLSTGRSWDVEQMHVLQEFCDYDQRGRGQAPSPGGPRRASEATPPAKRRALLVAGCLSCTLVVGVGVGLLAASRNVSDFSLEVFEALGHDSTGLSDLGPRESAEAAANVVHSTLEGLPIFNGTGTAAVDVAFPYDLALRGGDVMRRQGYPEEAIAQAYPVFLELAELEAGHAGEFLAKDTEEACEVLRREYALLRSRAMEGAQSAVEDFADLLFHLCTGSSPDLAGASARLRRAWTLHRRQMISTLAAAPVGQARPELSRLLEEWHARVAGKSSDMAEPWPAGSPPAQHVEEIEWQLWRRISSETQLTLLGFLLFLGCALLGIGIEESIGFDAYLRMDAERMQLLWMMAQAAFPAVTPLALISRSALAAPILVTGMWKCAFPEITNLLIEAGNHGTSLVKRAESALWGFGLLMHHCSAVWVLCFISVGRVVLSRSMMMLITPLIVAHLGIPLLRYRFVGIYLVLTLLCEAWFQVEFFAHVGSQVPLVKVPCITMLLAHYMFMVASVPLLFRYIGACPRKDAVVKVAVPEADSAGDKTGAIARQLDDDEDVEARDGDLGEASMSLAADPADGPAVCAESPQRSEDQHQHHTATIKVWKRRANGSELSVITARHSCVLWPTVAMLLCLGAGLMAGLSWQSVSARRGSVDYVSYAETEILRMYDLCGLVVGVPGVFGDGCVKVREALAAEPRFPRELPRHVRANYLAMTLAYPMTRIYHPAAAYISFTALRIHRALGYCNGLRLQGFADAAVDDACWLYDEVIRLQDQHASDTFSSRLAPEADCKLIDEEWEGLKQRYEDQLGFLGLGALHFQRSTMRTACFVGSDYRSYIVRSDWEHHRAEALGGALAGSTAILEYTYWHWHSFFEEDMAEQFLQSFLAFLK